MTRTQDLVEYVEGAITNCDLHQEYIKQIVAIIKNQPTITKEFIGKVIARIYCDRKSVKAIKTHLQESYEMIGIRIVTSGRNKD